MFVKCPIIGSQEEIGEETQQAPAESPVIADLAAYLQKMAAAALNRALREIDAQQAVEQVAAA